MFRIDDNPIKNVLNTFDYNRLIREPYLFFASVLKKMRIFAPEFRQESCRAMQRKHLYRFTVEFAQITML